jgi:putative Mn2+ efflux pump MntP
MYALTFIAFALVISMVPFSVSLQSSVYRCIEWKEALWISAVFAVMHALMASVGWAVGYGVKGWLSDMTVPVALFIMIFMALRFFIDARRKGHEARTMASKNLRILIGFAVVTGINTLLLGISLGLLYTGWLDFAGILAAIVFLISRLGIFAGKRGWLNLGKTAETLGSLVLFGIGVFILLQFLGLV